MKVNKPEIFGALAAVALAVPLVVFWHIRNNAYPNGDEAEYMWLSLRIFRHFLQEGVGAGLHGLYMDRLWKPILHSALMVPAVFLAGGRVLLAEGISALYFYVSLAIAVYALARNYLSRVDSVLATGALLNIQWMILPAHAVKSELSFALFFFASWAFVFSSHCFSRRWRAAAGGICVGLAACVRPAESALLFSVLLPGFFLFAWRGKKLPSRELGWGLVLAVIAIAPFIYILVHPTYEPLKVTLFALLTAVVGCFFLIRKGAKTWFMPFLLIAISITELWFAPYTQGLVGWVGFTSYQLGPQNIDHRVGFGAIIHLLNSALFGYGSLAILAAIAVSAWVARGSPRTGTSRVSGSVPDIPGSVVAVLAASSIHVSLGAISYNQDVRYYFVEVASLYLFGLIFILHSRQYIRVRRVFVLGVYSLMIMTQLQAYGVGFFQRAILARNQADFGNLGADAPWTRGEPGLEVFDQLAPHFQRLGTPSVLIYPVKGSEGFPRFMEPFTMKLIALSKGYEIEAAYPHPVLFEDWKTWHPREWRQFDYYLVGPLETEEPSLIREIKKEGDDDVFTFTLKDPSSSAPITLSWVSTHRQEK